MQQEELNRPGSLNSLVIRMANHQFFNSDFVTTFLACHELFTDSKELWEILEDRWNVPSDTSLTDEQVNFIKLRVMNVLVYWLKHDYSSIDPNVLVSISKFVEKPHKECASALGSIKKELNSIERFAPFADDKPPFSDDKVIIKNPTEIPIFGLAHHPYEILFYGDCRSIAEQITTFDFDLLLRIGKFELVNTRWAKPQFNILSRNVNQLAHRSEKLSLFIATSILLQKKLKERTKMLSRCISIAKYLNDLRNFNGLMSVLMGLNHSAVLRLKHTWSKLPPKYDEIFKQLTVIQNPTKQFKNYRDAFKSVVAPAIPYLTLSLTDIKFMEDGNPDYLNINESKLINFQKYESIIKTFKKIQIFQLSKYECSSREPLHTFLYQLPGLEAKELQQLSLEREPRNVTLRELEVRDRKE
uniref:Ras-GEF domain-containing protein n=1 Tax=Arcella intermedia TaxID=1963864 RepID=A0A6B2L4C5_9EUKA